MRSAPDAQQVIGVDVGGTKVLALLVELPVGAPPVILVREQLDSHAGSDAVLDQIEAAVGAVLGRAEHRPEGIGVGLAGFVDRLGIVRSAPNSSGLVDVDVSAHLESAFGLPAIVDNDANCVAVATHAGVGPSCMSLVAVTLGTGIGGGIIIGGHLLRGANGYAGEPGHMVIDPNGPECPCGQFGCWERYASGSGLERLARIAVEAGRAPNVLAAAGSVEDLRGEHVTGLLASGDVGAHEIFGEFAGYVALGLANVLVLLDPEVVVIGGGLSAHGELLIDLVTRSLDAHHPAAVKGRSARIMTSPDGPDAGAVGAAILASQRAGAA